MLEGWKNEEDIKKNQNAVSFWADCNSNLPPVVRTETLEYWKDKRIEE
jgi:hypothetical protein